MRQLDKDERAQTQIVLDLHNTESGRLFVMGTGPSLHLQADLMPELADKQTWGINRIHWWEGVPFETTYLTITESVHCSRHYIGEFLLPRTSDKRFAICNWRYQHTVEKRRFVWVSKRPNHTVDGDGFEGLGTDLPGLPQGYHTLLTSLQLAAWMGFDEFYLLGNELTMDGYVFNGSARRDGFGEYYDKCLPAYARARADLEAAGKKIVDCTPGGRLSLEGVLDFQPLQEVLNASTCTAKGKASGEEAGQD